VLPINGFKWLEVALRLYCIMVEWFWWIEAYRGGKLAFFSALTLLLG